MRGDRRTPVNGGGTTAVPAKDAGRVRPGHASVASMEVREPLRRSVTPFAMRPERGAAPVPADIPQSAGPVLSVCCVDVTPSYQLCAVVIGPGHRTFAAYTARSPQLCRYFPPLARKASRS